MVLAPELTVLEIIGIAVQKELDAAAFYRNLSKRVKNPLVIRKVESLAVEEDAHAAMLTEEYKRLSGGEDPVLPKGFSTGIDKEIAPDTPAETLIETAMKYEKAAQRFYMDASKRSEDPRGREVLEYLSNFEADHYRLLETELKQLKRNSEWFDQEHDLLHVGP